MASPPKFASKIGLIAATVGSAVGLGNVWRFPAEVQSNGGAAFLLIYIICIFLLGIPVMTADASPAPTFVPMEPPANIRLS